MNEFMSIFDIAVSCVTLGLVLVIAFEEKK